MGNCIESCRDNHQGEEEITEKVVYEEKNPQNLKGNIIGGGKKSGKNDGVRVKMVLTKEELQWLMLQLSNRGAANDGVNDGVNHGNKRIEEVLVEIERARKRVFAHQTWKPSLDTISEVPELQEMHR